MDVLDLFGEPVEKPDPFPVPVLPVQQVSDRVWLKRDDLYQPFMDSGLNGAKVYQCASLLHGCRDRIVRDFKSTVYTDTSIKSPQGPIVAKVAKSLGLKAIICIGSKSADYAKREHPAIKSAVESEAEIDCLCGPGAVMSLKHIARRKYARKAFHVAFGMNVADSFLRSLILGPVARQVEAFEGLPTEEMTLVVPSGSAVVFAGILRGLAERPHLRFRRIISVQIAGYDRSANIQTMLAGVEPPLYEHIVDTTFPYSKQVKASVEGVVLDTGYEAKAWEWVQRNLPEEPVLFYVVGNANMIR